MSGKIFTDAELEVVKIVLLRLDPMGHRIARALRDIFDQLYDGQRTGRYSWNQLYKVEREKAGHLIEINLQREFKFHDGTLLDYQIAGVEVDCKFSQSLNGWMIPPEARGHLCLVAWAIDNQTPKWSLGLVRVSEDRLNTGGNRDAKATLNKSGRDAIVWLFENSPLPPNVLLQLDPNIVKRIMTQDSGQKRVNELFRSALGKIVGRAVVATVAQQDDYMKRLRANGGARTDLQSEGIILLGQYKSHAAIASSFGLPVPGPGDTISVRITLATKDEAGSVEIGNKFWKIANPGDKVVKAPKLPKVSKTTIRKKAIWVS